MGLNAGLEKTSINWKKQIPGSPGLRAGAGGGGEGRSQTKCQDTIITKCFNRGFRNMDPPPTVSIKF